MRNKILFVDDERSVLQGLQRSLRGQRHVWEMTFAGGSSEALSLLDDNSFDAIVTDLRMPGIEGEEFLNLLVKDHPEAIRIILSGHSDEEVILKSAGIAHQFLTKPCSADTLKYTLERAFTLKSFLEDRQLQTLVSGLTRLPSIPKVYQEVMDSLRSTTASLRDVGEIISQDPAMTAKILQLVNSAFFGLGRHISDPRDAAALIGLDAIKALVLSLGIFHQFDQNQVKDKDFSIESLWKHSLVVAKLAQRIAKDYGADKSMADDCFLAGMLHDIGILILQHCTTEDYTEVRRLIESQGMNQCQAEQTIYHASHGAIGAYLLGLWGLPDKVVEAVAFHHQPGLSSCRQFGPLVAVYAAEVFVQQHGCSWNRFSIEDSRLDQEFLARVGVGGQLNHWAELEVMELHA